VPSRREALAGHDALRLWCGTARGPWPCLSPATAPRERAQRWPQAWLPSAVAFFLYSTCAHVLQETLAAYAARHERPAPTLPQRRCTAPTSPLSCPHSLYLDEAHISVIYDSIYSTWFMWLFLMCGQVVLSLLPLESNQGLKVYISLAFLEYVHLLLNVNYLLHFIWGFLYSCHVKKTVKYLFCLSLVSRILCHVTKVCFSSFM
jgi:hypothetical protein